MFGHVNRWGVASDGTFHVVFGRGWPMHIGEPGERDATEPLDAGHDGNPWAGDLTPPPFDALERKMLRVLPRLLHDDGPLVAFVTRFQELASGRVLDVGATMRTGADRIAMGLTLLRRSRPTTGSVSGATEALRTDPSRLAEDDAPRVRPEGATPQLGKAERRLLLLVGETFADETSLRHAIKRLSFFRDASGLGIGMDPVLIEGTILALDALLLLYADRPSDTWLGKRRKRTIIGAHWGRAGSQMRSLLTHLDADRQSTARPPCGSGQTGVAGRAEDVT